MAGPALYLSVLSRGIGEVHKNGNEKVDVYLEPEDYYNFTSNSDKVTLPPLDPGYSPITAHDQSHPTHYTSHEVQQFKVPKTFSTRKGALLLFSEDLAQRYKTSDADIHQHGAVSASGIHSKPHLKTVEDLANSVLKYGSQGHPGDQIYLKFVRASYGKSDRHIRPGFSARRYLTTWSRTWDDAILDSIVRQGYIKESSLYHYKLRRRLIYDDLSQMPQPYRLMKSMLMAADSLSGYTFYRTPTWERYESTVTQPISEDREKKLKTESTPEKGSSDKLKDIHVIKTKMGIQKEVVYADLDRHAQEEVIKDLLVKSAVHYALKKQEDIYNDSIIRAMRMEQEGITLVGDDGQTTRSDIYKFDMGEAVEVSMGQAKRRRKFLDPVWDTDRVYWYFVVAEQHDLTLQGRGLKIKPAKGTFGHYHDPLKGLRKRAERRVRKRLKLTLSLLDSHDGRITLGSGDNHEAELGSDSSLKEEAISVRSSRRQASHCSSIFGSEGEQENRDGQQGTAQRENSESPSSFSSVPSFPPIHATISPIRELSRETSDHVSLPPLVQAAGLIKPMKGSTIMAPDGEIISVGGAVGQDHRHSLSASSAGIHQENEVNTSDDKISVSDEEFSDEKTGKPRTLSRSKMTKKESKPQMSDVTENDIMDLLTEHAQRVAENVLSHPSSGTDLEADVKLAARLWSKMHPSKPFSQARVGGEFSTVMIDGISRSRHTSSSASSAEEYKSLIRKSLVTAVTNATGLHPDSIPDDAEISQELLNALASHKVTADQIEIVSDENGQAVMQARVDLADVTGEDQGECVIIPSGKYDEDGSDKRQTSFSADQTTIREDDDDENLPDQQSRSEPQETGKSTKQVHAGRPEKTNMGKKLSALLQKPAAAPSGRAGREKKAKDARNSQGSKAGLSQNREPLKGSKKKKPKEDKEEPFVTGMPKENNINRGHPPPHKEITVTKTKKKGKKEKIKKKVLPVEQPSVNSRVEELQEESLKTEEADLFLRETTPEVTESKPTSPELKTEDSELEFDFIREQSSPEQKFDAEVLSPQSPVSKQQTPPSAQLQDKKSDVEAQVNEAVSRLKTISNREARAAKQAAAAARRREEVEHRRKLKEEQSRREKEEMERQIMLQKEMEEQRKKGEEERRLRKQLQKETEERERVEAEEAERRQKAEAERERRMKEEYKRKLEEIKRKQQEEEMRRHELMLQKLKEEEEKKTAEELMLSRMALEERLQYERMKKEEEEERQKKELEDRLRQAEEAKKAFEEAQRLAEEMAREKAELEAKLWFNRSLLDEASQLTQAHQVNRAFVFSYFELLQWLGLDIPEFELAKLAQY